MQIKDYFTKYNSDVKIKYPHVVSDIVENSSECCQNAVFVALKGHHHNGINFIDEAIQKGAKTIIGEDEKVKLLKEVNYIVVKDAKVELARLLKWFYQAYPKPKIIAVSGTNGKTTITTGVFHILKKLKHHTLLIGTQNNISYYRGKTVYKKTINTTPAISNIYKLMYEHPYEYVVMEASSEGIAEGRLLGLNYEIVCFTNITQDHLNFHKTMDHYVFSKARLIYDLNPKGVLILNKQMAYYDLLKSLSLVNIKTYSLVNEFKLNEADIVGKITKHNLENMKINIKLLNQEEVSLTTKLIGGFNAENILATIAILDSLKIKMIDILPTLKNIKAVKGRMNLFKLDNKLILIDYAHTPDGIKQVLSYVRKETKGKIITLIGCGGERDQLKRPLIGEIVTSLSDEVIFTEDNSRSEDVNMIIKDLVSKIKKQHYQIIITREKAIDEALKIAKPNDLICLLGKGAETKIIANTIRPFSDIEYLKSLGGQEV